MIEDVRKFMLAARQTDEQINVRQTALYIGLQLEELAEKLGTLLVTADDLQDACEGPIVKTFSALYELSGIFKSGGADRVLGGLTIEDRAGMLDADMDLIWVTIGATLSQGNNAQGAWAEVSRTNLAKVANPQFDSNGKVIKPEGWKPPNLVPFVGCAG